MKRRVLVWTTVAVVAAVAAEAGAVTYDWRPGQGVPGVNGPVCSATTWDPDGPGPLPEWLVVGGNFSVAGDVIATGVAAWDGQRWHNLGEHPSGCSPILSLAVYEGDLVSGDWCGIYRLQKGVWEQMGDGSDWVSASALVVHDGQLFAGGSQGVSRWDGAHWQPVGTILGDYIQVTCLMVYDNDLIAGGNFSDTGAGACILRWDGQDWQPLGAGLECSADADEFNRRPCITGLAVLDGKLIAAGNFHQSGGDTTCRYIASWDGRTWQPYGQPVDFLPLRLGVYAGRLVCGTGWLPDNSGRPGVAVCEGGQWHFLPGNAYETSAVLEYNGDLVVGAYGLEVASTPCSAVARWDGWQWRALGEGMTGYPQVMGTYNGDLLMAGWFSGFGDEPFSGVLRGDGQQWQTMGSSLPASGGAVDSWIGTMTEYNGDLLIAGRFAEFGGVTCNSLARWGGQDWQPFGGATLEGKPAIISTLLVHGGDLYVGGFFDTVGGVPCRILARWDGSQWHDMGANLAGYSYWDDISRWDDISQMIMRYAEPSVECLTVWNGQIVAGGSFALAEGGPPVNVACWDGQAWQPLGQGIPGPYTWVYALAVYDGKLLAGGDFRPDPFDRDTQDTVPDLLAWDGQTWQPLGEPLHGSLGGLTIYEGQLIVTGNISIHANETDLYDLARWDGQQWHAMDNMLGFAPFGAFPYDGDLYVFGGLVLSHGRVIATVARWGPRYPGDLNADGHVDVVDLLILVDSYGKSAGDAGYDAACNLNGDNSVDVVDLMMMIDDFGK